MNAIVWAYRKVPEPSIRPPDTPASSTSSDPAAITAPTKKMPIHMRLPKLKGFTNPFRVEYQALNLDTLEASGLTDVDPGSLYAKGLVGKAALVKVLGRGELSRAVTVKAHAFSKSAEEAITAAGGSVERLPLPWGDRRPPAKGNQFTNR